MNILLDTQIFLWALTEPKRLGNKTKFLLQSKENQLYLSAASSWEISIKAGLEKLPLPESPDKYISSRMASLQILPLDVKHYHMFLNEPQRHRVHREKKEERFFHKSIKIAIFNSNKVIVRLFFKQEII